MKILRHFLWEGQNIKSLVLIYEKGGEIFGYEYESYKFGGNINQKWYIDSARAKIYLTYPTRKTPIHAQWYSPEFDIIWL